VLHRIIAAAFLLAFPLGVWAQDQSVAGMSDMTQAERDAFRAEVRAYLIEHPEVIREAIQVLEARRVAEEAKEDATRVAANADVLTNDGISWIGGNPDGDVTVVEFLDYRCGYCKRAHPEVKKLLESDPNIRLVVKEFPILGPDSIAAARMALAALEIDRGKFGDLHDALMSFEGSLTETVAYQFAAHAGYDIAALKERAGDAEIEARIRDNYALARALGIEGTPGFVVGDRILRGYLPLEGMVATVAEVRAATN